MKRVLVTRPREDAERTADRLRRMGLEPLISPVLEIAPTGAAIPTSAFDAVLATSARAVSLAGAGLDALSSLPFYVVGAKTGQAAERRGLRVAAVAPDVAGLVALLREAVGPERFLYLAGRERKDALERFLEESGRAVSTVETYEARPSRALSKAAIEALERGEIDAVLHYSPRSAKIYCALAAPGSLRSARDDGGAERLVHLALSEDVARVLRDAGCAHVRVAQAPDEESLLSLLRR